MNTFGQDDINYDPEMLAVNLIITNGIVPEDDEIEDVQPQIQQNLDPIGTRRKTLKKFKKKYVKLNKKDKDMEKLMTKLVPKKASQDNYQVTIDGKKGKLTKKLGNEAIIFPDASSGEVNKERCNKNCNLFQIKDTLHKNFHIYQVNFSPGINDEKHKKYLIQLIENSLGLTETLYITDGTAIVTDKLLKDNSQDGTSQFSTIVKEFQVVVTNVGRIDKDQNHMVEILNVLFASNIENCCGLKWSERDEFYNFSQMKAIEGTNFSFFSGFAAKVFGCDSGFRVMLDVIYKVVDNQNVWDHCNHEMKTAKRNLKGRLAMSCLTGKTYRICGVETEKNILHKFKRDGRRMSVKYYYQEEYHIEIKDANQPLLLAMPENREGLEPIQYGYLVPELCVLTGLDEKEKNPSARRIKAATNSTVKARSDLIEEFAQDISDDIDSILNKFGFEIRPGMLSIQGRIMPNITTRIDKTAPEGLYNWLIVSPGDLNGDLREEEFFKDLQQSLQHIGLEFNKPKQKAYKKMSDLNTILKNSGLESESNISLIVVVLNTQDSFMYNNVMKILCVKNPVANQVIVSKVMKDSSNRGEICFHIAEQIYQKIKGINWFVKELKSSDMVIGVGFCQDTVTAEVFYLTMVSSLDEHCSKHHICWKKSNGNNLGQDLRAMMHGCLNAYFDFNHQPSQNIVVYCSDIDDQAELKMLELNTKQVIEEIDWKDTGLAIIQVDMNPQVFFKGASKAMIFNGSLTKRFKSEFFLFGDETTGQTTPRPTHYSIFSNNSNMTLEGIESLTYKLCHMYTSTAMIKVPSLCEYAHKLAVLLGNNLHCVPAQELSDKLFFI